jgi:hypothetical protein
MFFGLKITEEEEQRAFKRTFSMRNTSSMLTLVNQVASRYRSQHRTAQRNNFSTEQRRQDNNLFQQLAVFKVSNKTLRGGTIIQ